MVTKRLFTQLGFCYVATVLFMAQGSIITAINTVKYCQGQENCLARQNYRGDGDCKRIPGPPGSAQTARSIDYLWSRGEISATAIAKMIARDEIQNLAPNCALVWTSSWCGACKKMPPIVAQLKKEGYTVYNFDLEEHDTSAKLLKVEKVPTIIIFEQRKEVKRFIGVTSAEEIKKYLKHDNTISPNLW